MSTNAIPLSGGMAEKNLLNASSPPAEAPMPTTGNCKVCMSDSAGCGPSVGGRVLSGDGCVLSGDGRGVIFFFFAATAAFSSRR